MKKIFILICTLFTIGAVSAQCPQYLAFDTTVCGNSVNKTIDATILESRLCGDSVTIVFDDSATSLSGSHQVYLHTGPEFVPFEGWQNAYTQNAAMQHISTHLWKITFNPRSFYGYSPDSCLNSVALGFTDSGYVNYLKCGSNADIYVVVATGTAVNTCASATFFTATYTHAPVSYLWNDGNTNGIRTFTTGGNYTVTASGVGGCSVTGTVKITLDNKKVSIGDDTIECSTYSYVFVATPGFSTYQWLDANPTTSNTHQALTVAGGTYWVHAIDSNGCASNDTATVHLSPTGYLSIPDSLTSCPGVPVSVDASTSINANGDSIVIIYNATLGQSQLAGDTNVYFFSAPQFYPFATWPANDPYTVGTFGSNNGVGRMTSLGNNLWRIAIDPQAYYHFSPDTPLNGIWMIFTNFNGTKTGKDTTGNNIFVYTVPLVPTSSSDAVTAYRKAGPVSYTWSNGIHTAADTFTTAGTYYVTATDGVCTHTDSVVVRFSSSGTINIGADTTVCSGADSVRFSAGAGYAHYAWSNGDTTASIKVNAATTYTVTATTLAGCVSVGHRKLSIGGHSVSLGSDQVRCTNAPVLLTATPGFASYTFLDRAPSRDTLTVSKTGTYWVSATDSFGCVAYDTVSIRYSDVLLASLQDTINSCPGSLVSLDAGSNIAVYGDSITIFYDATQGQTQLLGDSNVYFYSAPQLYPFAGWPGNDPYTQGVYGSNNGVGRMDSLGNNRWSITIFPQSYYHVSPDSPIIGIWMIFTNYNGTKTGKDAGGNNIFLNLTTANPTSTFSGVSAIHKEAGTMTYAWSNGQIAPAIVVDTTGHYTVTVSDGTCSNAVSTFVNLSSNLAVHIGHDTSICQSGSVTFNAGAGFIHYHWSNGDTTQTITVSAAGSYAVTVTAASGCTGSDTAIVHVSGAKVNAGADITRCNKLPVTLTASSGFASYQWFGMGTSSQTYSAVNDGCYWVEATDSAGCTSFDTVCVSTSGVVGLHSRDTVNTCVGTTSTFDASTNVNASGDSLVITFDATQNTNSANLLGASKVYMHSAPQFYSFAPWPANDPYTVGHWGQDDGLGEMDSVGPNKWQITIFPSCYYHYNPDTPLIGIWMVFRNANGTEQSLGGNINIYVGGDTPTTPYTGLSARYKSTNNISYSWSTGATTPAVTFSSSGTYYVTASDGTCSKTDTILVNQNAGPTVNLGDDTCAASGSPVTLNAGTGFSAYLWSTGASTQSITAITAGTYWVRVTNAAGCTGSDTVIVSNGVTINLSKDTCLQPGATDLLNVFNAGATYHWSTGATTDTLHINGNVFGIFSVTVTNSGGCTASDTITISRGAGVTVSGDTCIAHGGSVLLKANVSGTATYLWNNGATTDTLRAMAAGKYAVKVTEAGGCIVRDTVVVDSCAHTVIEGCIPVAYFRVINVSPSNTVTLKDSSYNEYGTVHYFWNFGDGSPIDSTSGSQVHSYWPSSIDTIRLTVCDSCGCDTFTKVVNVNYTGISEITELNDVNLYPNPASNNCTIILNATESLDATIEISNMLGAEVVSLGKHINAGGNRILLDLSGISSGMYIVTIRSASGIMTKKLDIIK